MATSWQRVFGIILALLLLASAIAAAIAGGIGVADGADPKAHLSVTLEEWLLVYGIVGLLLLILAVINRFTGEKFWGWVWGVLAVFLVFPWLIVGQIILLQGTNYPQDGGEFGIGVFALVVSYLMALAGVGQVSYLFDRYNIV